GNASPAGRGLCDRRRARARRDRARRDDRARARARLSRRGGDPLRGPAGPARHRRARRRAESALMEVALADAVAWIVRGGVLAYPTETVWGLGADARSDAGDAKIGRAACGERGW